MVAKKLFRSAATKLLAFLLILACVVGAAGTIGQMVEQVYRESDSGKWAYRFESSFADSRYVSELMYNQVNNLDYALREGDIARYLTEFPGDYYGRYGTTEYKNVDLDENDILASRFYCVVREDGVESNVPVFYSQDILEEEVLDPQQRVLMVRLTDAQTAPLEAQWNEQKTLCYDTVKSVLLLAVLALVLFLYLLFVTGRKAEDDEVHLITIDRLFVEFNVALAVGSAVLGVAVYTALLGELSYNNDVAILLWPAIVLLAVCTALTLELLLSLVRNVKNRSFVARSFVLRAGKWCWKILVKAWLWCWKTIKRVWHWLITVCKKTWHALGRGKDSLWNALFKNYKTRNVVLIFLGYSVLLAVLAMLFGMLVDYGEGFFVFVLGVVWFVIAAAFLANRIGGFEGIVEGLKRLRGGELTYKLEGLPAGVLSNIADDINSLGDGMQAALQNEIRAERMKSELITNVSHDLKTPLTSILNYSDLLCQERLTPDEANDYAKIIYQKSMRLKNLTSDLFDISKVQSGVEQVVRERLDVCTLVRQALGEQDQALAGGDFVLKLSMPEREVSILADGKKMSRVLENLIGNCIKYALKGTRVFVSVAQTEDAAVIEIKNTANYAMDFDSSEITERFVRGDAARSTEGSGLGLAIAKSYVSACGGTLKVDVDGDLFKVVIHFPLYGLTAQ